MGVKVIEENSEEKILRIALYAFRNAEEDLFSFVENFLFCKQL